MTNSRRIPAESPQVALRAQLKALRAIALEQGMALAAEVLRKHLNAAYQLNPKKEVPRRKGGHAVRPNRNNSSGIQGIRAFYQDRALQFVATWREAGPEGKTRARTAQFSSAAHGTLGALELALNARQQGARQRMPSPRTAWELVRSRIGPPPDGAR